MTNTNKADLIITAVQCRTKAVRSEEKQARINANLSTWVKAQTKRAKKANSKKVTKEESAKKKAYRKALKAKGWR